MISSHANAAFTEIGKAIFVSQQLEKILIEMFEFRKLHLDFEYAKETMGAIAPELYKMALMNGIKKLRSQNAIDPSLDKALVKYIDDRHVLVHRWCLNHGFPDYADAQAWNKLHAHAKSLVKQVAQLYDFFTSYLAEYGTMEVAIKDYPAYEARMLNMFNQKFEPK